MEFPSDPPAPELLQFALAFSNLELVCAWFGDGFVLVSAWFGLVMVLGWFGVGLGMIR